VAPRKKLNHWNIAGSTYARRFKAKALIAVLLTAAVAVGPLVLVSGSASAITIPGIEGYITSDGLFFVQVGYTTLLNFVTYIGNGSQVYSAGIIVNVTAITTSSQVAHIYVYSYTTRTVISTENVVVPGYASLAVTVALPTNQSWLEYRVDVDQTPWWFYAFTPYSFLGVLNLENGGIDLATFIAVGLFFAYAIPVMVKAERMTKRAIYSPKWNATIWLHGIFFGLVADYFAYFQWWNMTFHGWEFVFIPIPEAIFLFFWTAGRHSSNRRALFIQIVPRMGQRLGVIMRDFFVGQDKDGDLVIMRSRSPIQWWYRSRGHHVKVFRRSEAGALEPFPLDVLEQQRLTEDQVRDPQRFPRGAKYDAHDDFPVVSSDESEDYPFERLYFVPRVSAFRVTWPHAAIHRDVLVPEHTDLLTQTRVPAETKSKLCWPYVKDGHAEVTLCSWHFMDVLAQAMGYMTAEDLATECDNLAVQLAAERGFRETETDRKASERTLAEDDVRNRPYTDIPEGELDQHVQPLPERRRDRKALPSGGESGA
jgi:hypothetical protein